MNELTALKAPPHNIEVEFAIIGAILTDKEAMDEAIDFITAEMFYRPENRIMFEMCARESANNHAVDTVSIAEVLNNASLLDEVGGNEYLVEVVSNGRGTANLLHYFKLLKNKWLERELLRASYIASDVVYSSASTEDKLHTAQVAIMAVGEDSYKSDLRPASEILIEAIKEIDKRANSAGSMVGISTGFIDIDKKTGGFEPGSLIIIAGRPSMGKTTLAMNIAEKAAITGKKSLFFSLEMPEQSIIMRSISSIGRVPHNKVRTGKLTDGEWDSVSKAAVKIKDSKLSIDDTSALTTSSLRAKVRRYTRRHGNPDIIVVDYIQIMGDKVNGNDTSRITVISRNLKAIAKEFSCPLIALSQLNRGVESREDKRPRMSDLRDSGALEQDADIIMMMYRDEYYNEESNRKGIAECNITKQRNGQTGMVPLTSELQHVRFSNFIGTLPPIGTLGKLRRYSSEEL